jgi:hypothetical protein
MHCSEHGTFYNEANDCPYCREELEDRDNLPYMLRILAVIVFIAAVIGGFLEWR